MEWSTLEEIKSELSDLAQSDDVNRIAKLGRARSLIWQANREIDDAAAAASAAQKKQALLTQKRANLREVLKVKKASLEKARKVGNTVAEQLDLMPIDEYLERFPDHKSKTGEQLLRLRIDDEKAQRLELAVKVDELLNLHTRRRDAYIMAVRCINEPSTKWKSRKSRSWDGSSRSDLVVSVDSDYRQDLDSLAAVGKFLKTYYGDCVDMLHALEDSSDHEAD